MGDSIWYKLRNAFISLRFSIVSIIVALFISAILILVIVNYKFSSASMLYMARMLMQKVSETLYVELSNEIKQTTNALDIAIDEIQEDVASANDPIELMNLTVALANQFNLQQAAFWGDEQGNFVKAEYEDDESLTTEIINRNITPPLSQIMYRKYNGTIFRTLQSNEVTYDPRTRPWYKQAVAAQSTIWTDIYLFEPNNYLGITAAKPAYDRKGKLLGVFGIDISLYWLSWFVGQQKISENSQIFIVRNDGKIIAFPKIYELQQFGNKMIDIHSIKMPWLALSFDIHTKTKNTVFDFKYNGETYLATYNTIPKFETFGWIIGVVIPSSDFTDKLVMQNWIDVGIGLLILIIGIFLVSTFISRIVVPIKQIVKQTEKIRRFELDDNEKVTSRITEVALLSRAVQALRSGLQSFQKYVPASLVRQLIAAGENARIGGSKKRLTIFFSDIENFTSISESMEPDKLMEYICEYFDEISKIITEESGTIDKYIGDSIMAFWGAPVSVKEPEIHAVRAGLHCIAHINKLNKIWTKKGKTPLITRIGIHSGIVIVGNLGSSERLNYTAIGDAINVASRLEGVNKLYGTKILISDHLYHQVKNQFVIRKIDFVTVKGKLISTTIYEVLAENKQELAFNFDAYVKAFEQGFDRYQHQQWDKAIRFFQECLIIYPTDTVALIFIKRCEQFKINPPQQWDGIWRIM